MSLNKYKFEVMLIVIVVVLLIFWMMINWFDNKNSHSGNNNFAPINSNSVNNMAGRNTYNVESFQNGDTANTIANTPANTIANTPATVTTQNNDIRVVTNDIATSATPSNTKNELQNLSSNETVPSFKALTGGQLTELKQQTRKYGVLGLVFYDSDSDTLRIESTKT